MHVLKVFKRHEARKVNFPFMISVPGRLSPGSCTKSAHKITTWKVVSIYLVVPYSLPFAPL